MASARRKVVIVGGGAGGLILANSLAIRGEYDITLINDTPYHYYWPQLLQIAFRGDDRQLRRPIDSLVRRGVNLVIERAETVNLQERKVVLASGRELT
ncbi:MAG: FAD-dependent oxidoreductase, partial [Acidilobus sp.]|nr:FAD-dependent oxidoreductase [Acidilobus sp.]